MISLTHAHQLDHDAAFVPPARVTRHPAKGRATIGVCAFCAAYHSHGNGDDPGGAKRLRSLARMGVVRIAGVALCERHLRIVREIQHADRIRRGIA